MVNFHSLITQLIFLLLLFFFSFFKIFSSLYGAEMKLAKQIPGSMPIFDLCLVAQPFFVAEGDL